MVDSNQRSSFPRQAAAIAVVFIAFNLATASNPTSLGDIVVSQYSEVAPKAPGVPESSIYAGFENNENVSLYNGNLMVNHPGSPSYALDGGGRFSLLRTYNSKSAAAERFRQSYCAVNGVEFETTYENGDSWVGYGWCPPLQNNASSVVRNS